MSITPNVIDPRRAAPPPQTPDAQVDPAVKLRKRVYMAFGTSAGLVLLIALVYIGGRVFAGPGIQIPTAAPAKIAPAPKVAKAPPVVPQVVPPPPVVAQIIAPPKVQPPAIAAPVPQVPPVGPLAQSQTWTSVT